MLVLRLDSRPEKNTAKVNPKWVCGIPGGGMEAWVVMPKKQARVRTLSAVGSEGGGSP